jgi:hypothetical protein
MSAVAGQGVVESVGPVCGVGWVAGGTDGCRFICSPGLRPLCLIRVAAGCGPANSSQWEVTRMRENFSLSDYARRGR